MAAEKVSAARGGAREGQEDEVLSCQSGPAADLSLFWRGLWRLRVLCPCESTLRSGLSWVFGRCGLVWLRVRLTCSVAVVPLWSISYHLSPRSSPSLRQQCRAST